MAVNSSILIVKTGFGLGGIERSLIEFLRHLDYSKYEVDLLLLYGPFDLCAELPSQVHLLNVEEHQIQLKLSPLYVFFYLLSTISKISSINRAYHAFKQKKQDIYYRSIYRHFCNDTIYDAVLAYQQGFACEYVARFTKARRKIMMYHHGDIQDIEYHTPWFQEADVLLTVSHDVAVKLETTYPFVKNKVAVIPNLLDANVIREKAEEYAPKLEKNVLTLCTCGRISPEKGFDLAIEAAKILSEKGIPFHWYFVGDGYDKVYVDSIRQQISVNGLDDRITITGFLTNPYPYIKNCDIVVIPSRFEANPMIVQEAKILCKPIIATRTEGASSLIKNEETGILCDFDSHSIAKAIMNIIASSELKKQLEINLMNLDYNTQKNNFYKMWDNLLIDDMC